MQGRKSVIERTLFSLKNGARQEGIAGSVGEPELKIHETPGKLKFVSFESMLE